MKPLTGIVASAMLMALSSLVLVHAPAEAQITFPNLKIQRTLGISMLSSGGNPYFHVQNTGFTKSKATTVLVLFFTQCSAQPVRQTYTLPALAPGVATAVHVAYPTYCSTTLRYRIIVDPDDFVPESNEGDNVVEDSRILNLGS